MNLQLLSTILLCCFSYFNSTAQIDIKTIDNQTISIQPNEKQEYYLDLNKNQFAFMRFEQKGADIYIQIKSPEGKLLMQYDTGNGKMRPELVQIIPSKDGKYQVVVAAHEEQKKKGNFTFQLEKIVEKAPTLNAQLHQIFEYWEAQAFIPGFSTSIVTKDAILFQNAYGYANLKEQKPYTTETLQNMVRSLKL